MLKLISRRKSLCPLGRQTFLRHNTKMLIYERHIDQVDLIRIKKCFQKTFFREWTDSHRLRKYLQSTYLIQDLHVKYRSNIWKFSKNVGKILNIHFREENIQMTSKHIKFLQINTSLFISERQVKAMMIYIHLGMT